MLEFVSYFIIGGLVVSFTVFYGSKGQGFLAALISMFPSITVLTFILLYKAGGKASVIHYAKSLVYVVPPWVCYVVTVTYLCERIGILWSLVIGISLYVSASLCLSQLR
jgi:uncharacterized membrane protein (GlpM family)